MKQNKLRESMAEAFLAALQEDKLPWHSMWTSMRPKNAITDKKYKGINSFWLSFVAELKGYDDNRWCTFKQAESKGWHVKKGEKASSIEYWRLYDKLQKKYIEWPEARQIVSDDPEREKDIILTCRTYCVFNAKQIEGIPEPVHENNVDIEDIRSKRDVLLNNMDLKFRESGSEAYYQPLLDRITMPPERTFLDTYGYMSTFLHEAGHATGHKKRLDRDLTGSFGSVSYAKEELRAEIASAFTAQALSLSSDGTVPSDRLDNHKAYIQSWIEVIQDKPNELFAAIKDAEGISDYLLEKGEFLKEQGREGEAPQKTPSLDEQIQSASMMSGSKTVAARVLEPVR